jgi:signal transduction histidine kinase/signal recognition particle receptor subunit beta
MGFLSISDKTVNAKLVYYGVGLGGKTTSLQAIHRILCPGDEVKLVSINTDQDSTLLFDFLPINLGQVEGFRIRIQGFTVPGQPKYRAMRKYVLSGADAVVFVVDSQRKRMAENVQSFQDLKANLRFNRIDADKVPLVVQYNKRDLPDLVPTEELDPQFLTGDRRGFPTVATAGEGVFDAFCHAVRLVVEQKVAQYGLGKGAVTPASVADEAVKRLREHHEEAAGRRGTAAGQPSGLVSLTLPEAAPAPAPTPDAPALDAPAVGATEAQAGDASPATEAQASDASAATEAPSGDVAALDQGWLGQVVHSNIELAQLYTELATYKNLLERKNRELVEINQLISHDLKKPLTAIKAVVSLFAKGYLGQLTSEQGDAIGNTSQAIDYMEELIADIIDSSRLDYDGVEFEFTPVDVAVLVARILGKLKYHLRETGVRVTVEPLPTIQADEPALTRILTNLIGNAINYREPTRPGMVRISAVSDPDQHVITVADNGIGIPGGDQEKIFKKFSRGSNTGGVSGTGLGLYIVQELARGHGGMIRCESTLGQGTTFHVVIPRSPRAPEHSRVSTLQQS